VERGRLLRAWIVAQSSRRGEFQHDPNAISIRGNDDSGRILKNGDGSVRAVLDDAGHLISPGRSKAAPPGWAMRIAKRAELKKAPVTLARNLAVIMRRCS
jgi:hypothetical protein